MKKTRYILEIEKKDKKYRIVKAIIFFQMKFSFGKSKRIWKSTYELFDYYRLDGRITNSLKESYYYSPKDIIVYDIVSKKDMSKIKRGLIRLYKKCATHKYITGGRDANSIEELTEWLDGRLDNLESWHNIGFFDFAYDKELDGFIDHFELFFHNFSSSYVAIEMHIVLANCFVEEISQFIKAEYNKPGMCVTRNWINTNTVSGAKIGYGVSPGESNEYAKKRIIFEQLEYVKNIFLDEIINFFPLINYLKFKRSIGINVFETNIRPDLGLSHIVLGSLGMNEREGFYLSKAERLYMSIEDIYFYRSSYDSDMLLVYNPDFVEENGIYKTKHNTVLREFTEEFMSYLYRLLIMKHFGEGLLNLIKEYRNKNDAIKENIISHKKLLKMKYNLGRDFYDYSKIDDEVPIKSEVQIVNSFLETNQYITASVYYGHHPYKLFAKEAQDKWEQVRVNYDEIQKDIDRKIEISSRLINYSGENVNKIIMGFQLMIAFVTLVLLIFPQKAEEIAELVSSIGVYFRILFERML